MSFIADHIHRDLVNIADEIYNSGLRANDEIKKRDDIIKQFVKLTQRIYKDEYGNWHIDDRDKQKIDQLIEDMVLYGQ